MKKNKSFLGTGWGFPPTFNNKDGSVQMVSEEEDIKQSLKIILLTSYGERIMYPYFGSNLSEAVFDTMDSVTINTIKDNIQQAILEFEPRVSLNNVEVVIDDAYNGKLLITLDYTIRLINVRTNMVFPFYFMEGSNVSLV